MPAEHADVELAQPIFTTSGRGDLDVVQHEGDLPWHRIQDKRTVWAREIVPDQATTSQME
ncbi:hypothetical protein GCM10027436_44980 [Actinophytocola sediminis]